MLASGFTPGTAVALEEPAVMSAILERADGPVTVQRKGQRLLLKPGDTIRAAETIQVGRQSRARLLLGDHGPAELGPSTRLRIDTLGNSGIAPAQLRLENGFVRFETPVSGVRSLRLAFATWSAEIGAGEAMVQAGATQASICGEPPSTLRLDGTSRDTPIEMPATCVRLTRGRAPAAFDADPTMLAAARGQFDLRRIFSQTASRGVDAAPIPTPRPNPVIVLTPAADDATTTLQAASTFAAPESEVMVSAVAPTALDPSASSDLEREKAAVAAIVRSPVPEPLDLPPTAAGPSASSAFVETALAEPSVAPATLGPEWIVNIASFNEADVGAAAVKALGDRGIPAVLREEMVRGRATWRAVVPGFPDEAQANVVARRLSREHGYRAAWALRTR
jgi:hypothetical protein